MTSTYTKGDGPLPLPDALVPDGCPALDAQAARRWTAALPPLRVPARTATGGATFAVSVAALVASGSLCLYAGLPAFAAALVALHLVWLPARPEAAVLTAPLTAVLLLVAPHGAPLAVRLAVVVVLAAVWGLALTRVRARARQRAAAEAAAGGVTAAVPAGRAPVRRGRFMTGAGVLVVVSAAVLFGFQDAWDLAEDRQAVPAVAAGVLGLGLTVLLSGLLARRRAGALRTAPVPVLRVLVREGADMDTEVFAADDSAALCPLFTVGTALLDEDDEDDEDDSEHHDDGDKDEEAAAQEFQDLLDRIDEEQPGPLREAVLYGVPYDGAEIVLVSAAETPGEPPVKEGSTGPVRPLSEHAARRRTTRETRAAADDQADRERLDALTASVAGGQVRRWRAGPRDWAMGLVALFLATNLVLDESGLWRWIPGLIAGLLGVGALPHIVAWRVTADRDGLWLDGMKGPRHIAWEHLRVVKAVGSELKIDSTRRDFVEWTLFSPRWRRLERRLGRVHRLDRMAAEIDALWKDEARRPAEPAAARHRGRSLWPYAVATALVWTALLFLVP
ncbi:hypothetical protein [Streptomyces sp. NPDC058739]|uniref:hypothetical protein n=1 Tax=Streptomyces sp. NPDC058739 TaxID=3346618 RepID=UPI0036B202D6